MDTLYYTLLTGLVIFISFVTFIVLITVHIAKKKKPNILCYIVLLLCMVGMYLFIPSRYVYMGYAFQSPDLLEKAVKLSINPYEKRLAYLFMADVYEYDIHGENLKNGNLAIEYLEKAIQGEYEKYKLETIRLSTLYSIKNDYDKTVEINKILNYKQTLSLRNIYIMNNEYDKALATFNEDNKSVENFLKADLYKKVGKSKEAKQTKKLAKETYDYQLKSCKTKSKQLEYIEKTEKFKTVENYKEYLQEQQKEYKF